VRYKVGFYIDSIPPVNDADNAKLYGLSQFAITNFNPATTTVWLHNDLNTNNTSTGLASGFHIVRARCFLPRAGKSGVYNTFLQTFYYYGKLPNGVIAYPSSDGASITNSTYTVVVRADSTVTEVDYTINDSNGQTTGVAASVTANSTISAQYTNYPKEFRFTYGQIPGSGTSTIGVQLKTFATAAYANRQTTLTRTVQTLAPALTLQFAQPAANGAVLLLNSNDTYTIQACFSSSLAYGSNLFGIYINGVLQPRSSYLFRAPGSVSGCAGMRSLFYIWANAISGTNVIEVIYTNGLTLADSRTVAVARIGDPTDSDGDGVPNWMEVLAGTNPYDANSFLRITGLAPGNPVMLSWSSVPNKVYQILSTTNLAYPMAVIPNTLVPADPGATVTHWFDSAPDATNKFYRIQVVQ
jgi:hypothetical protein